jgi:tripartite-type tricarboxylate transporter receptor subunit TctC
MHKDTKRLAGLMVTLLALLIAERSAAQSNYPAKPIRMIVGAAPGNPSDIIARLLGQQFSEVMGQPVVIDNTPGAAGNIAAERVAKATPDGYTLGTLALGPIVINPALYKLPYDPLNDIAPVSQLAVQANVLVVHNAVPAKTVKELVALATAQPGVLTFASGGSGAHGRRVVQVCCGARHRSHPLQKRGFGFARFAGRPRNNDIFADNDGLAAGARRQVACARVDLGGAFASGAGISNHC